MKRTFMCVATVLFAALAVGMLAGCGSQPAPSASGSDTSPVSAVPASSESDTSTADAATDQSQDEIIAELKDVLNNSPEFKSVTVTEETLATAVADTDAAVADTSAAPDSIATKTVYKFDESGDTVRTSTTYEVGDIALQYITDGDNVACVTDGPIYSGTAEQFELPHAAGFKAYLKSATGDMNAIIDCVATVSKSQQDGMTVYELTLDPEKRIASDEVFQILAESGDPILSESIIVGFDANNYLVWANEKREFQASAAEKNMTFTDFDSTVVEPMPEADKTFEDMEADIDAKYEDFFAELEKAEGAEGAVSPEAAEVK